MLFRPPFFYFQFSDYSVSPAARELVSKISPIKKQNIKLKSQFPDAMYLQI